MRRVSNAEIKFILTTGSSHPHEPLFPVDSTKGLDSFVRDTLLALSRMSRRGFEKDVISYRSHFKDTSIAFGQEMKILVHKIMAD